MALSDKDLLLIEFARCNNIHSPKTLATAMNIPFRSLSHQVREIVMSPVYGTELLGFLKKAERAVKFKNNKDTYERAIERLGMNIDEFFYFFTECALDCAGYPEFDSFWEGYKDWVGSARFPNTRADHFDNTYYEFIEGEVVEVPTDSIGFKFIPDASRTFKIGGRVVLFNFMLSNQVQEGSVVGVFATVVRNSLTGSERCVARMFYKQGEDHVYRA